MTPIQEAFVAKRAEQIRYFPWIGGVLVTLILGFCVFAYVRFPLYANPGFLADQLHANKVDPSTLAWMAGFGSLALVGCVAFLLLVFLVMFLSLWNEKRLIDIIRAQNAELKGFQPGEQASPEEDVPVLEGDSPTVAAQDDAATEAPPEEPKEGP